MKISYQHHLLSKLTTTLFTRDVRRFVAPSISPSSRREIDLSCPWAKNSCTLPYGKYADALSPRHGTSMSCGWREGIQLRMVAENVLNKQPRTFINNVSQKPQEALNLFSTPRPQCNVSHYHPNFLFSPYPSIFR
jgi:hypothetical protein